MARTKPKQSKGGREELGPAMGRVEKFCEAAIFKCIKHISFINSAYYNISLTAVQQASHLYFRIQQWSSVYAQEQCPSRSSVRRYEEWRGYMLRHRPACSLRTSARRRALLRDMALH